MTPEQSRVLRQQEIQASKNLTALKDLSKKYVKRLNELLIEATNNFFKKFQFNEELPKGPESYDAFLNRKEEIFIGTLDKEIIDNKEDNSSNKSIVEKQLEDNQAELAGLIVVLIIYLFKCLKESFYLEISGKININIFKVYGYFASS